MQAFKPIQFADLQIIRTEQSTDGDRDKVVIRDIVGAVPPSIGAEAGAENDEDIDNPESADQDPLIIYAQVESRMDNMPVLMELDVRYWLCAQNLAFL